MKKYYTISLEEGTIEIIAQMANDMDIPPRILARKLLLAGLRREHNKTRGNDDRSQAQ